MRRIYAVLFTVLFLVMLWVISNLKAQVILLEKEKEYYIMLFTQQNEFNDRIGLQAEETQTLLDSLYKGIESINASQSKEIYELKRKVRYWQRKSYDTVYVSDQWINSVLIKQN